LRLEGFIGLLQGKPFNHRLSFGTATFQYDLRIGVCPSVSAAECASWN
jgi:hypothetical protein